jgi:outer membrane murein-binding lipoprotein Lpp
MKTARLSLIIVILLLSGCTSSHAWSEKDMNELGSALTKLCSAVHCALQRNGGRPARR